MKILASILLGLTVTVSTLTAEAQTVQRRPAQTRKTVTPSYQQPTGSVYGLSYFQNEFDLNLSEGSLRTVDIGPKTITVINIYGAYSYDLGNQIQVGGDVGLEVNDSDTGFTIVGTGTYNFDPNYSDAFFAKAGLGLFPVTKATATGGTEIKNEFGFYVGGGKRFKLWDHVNYKPMLTIAKISDQDAVFGIQFLNVSLNW